MKRSSLFYSLHVLLGCCLLCLARIDGSPGSSVWGAEPTASAIEPGEGYHLVGQVKPRHAREIVGSNWSIGAETMDRDFTIYANWKSYLGPLGAKAARVQSGWAKTEKEMGKYDWAWLDAIIPDMVQQGVKPWVCLCYGNPIYPGGGGVGLGGGLPSSPEALAAWDKYIAAVVTRYGKHVDQWEIWNEPGLHLKKGVKPDMRQAATDYADFFIRTAKVVRREQPRARILGLSLPGMPLKFAEGVLERLAETKEIGLLDELTYHPYNANPDASYATVEKLRAMLRSYAPQASLRQGENGCPSEKGGFGAIANEDWNEASQAKWALRRLLGDRGRDIPSSYFSICDMQYPDRRNFKGLLAINDDKTVHHAKHAYYAVQRVTAIFDNTVHRLADFAGRVDGAEGKETFSLFAYRTDSGAKLVTLWRNNHRPGERSDVERLTVTLPGVQFSQPVWVDLLSGKVYRIDASLVGVKNGATEFRNVPVYDSVVVLADQSVIPLSAPAK